jgi:DNA-binding YbaB/EbfC family protein
MTTDGGFDLSSLLQQAQAMQEQLSAAQEAQAAKTVTGTGGGGKVTVEATGGGEFRRITISPDVVDPDDVELLEELILAAVRDAANQIAELQTSAMGDLQLPDLGSLGGLGGLLGDGS